ncbi:hypothetical protein BCON_0129g00050 [Botryotinia convoluta]|uniref:Asl1-like glycosyl hydrolase catalytic domain-containing protein n=1 Tax=Botryotinia convoluta TaxID=54673 RepID=A0A4Z1HVS4_9HELO|nr:hypothetical protein BCON_0129g00050 [Botryotinia convoluta]
MLASLITGLLALTTISVSSPILAAKRDTAELYILSNCYNNLTHTSYASAFWYYPDFLPDYPEPQAVGVINAQKASGALAYITFSSTLQIIEGTHGDTKESITSYAEDCWAV